MLRSVGAVIVGFVASAVLVVLGTLGAALALAGPDGAPTPAYLAANLAVSLGAALSGGGTAAWVARRRPLLHAGVLALIMAAMSLPGLGRPAAGQPTWYPAALLVIGAGGALAGGWWASRRASALVRA